MFFILSFTTIIGLQGNKWVFITEKKIKEIIFSMDKFVETSNDFDYWSENLLTNWQKYLFTNFEAW